MKYYWHRYGFPWLVAALVFSLWIGTAHAQSSQQMADFFAGQWPITAQQAHDCQQLGNVMSIVAAGRDSGESEASWKTATFIKTFGPREVKMNAWQLAGVRKDTFLFLVKDLYHRSDITPASARIAYNVQCRNVVGNMNRTQPIDISEGQ